MKNINFIAIALVLIVVGLFAGSVSAQYRIPAPPPRPTFCPAGMPSAYIRNLRYDDYSSLSRLSTNTVGLGGYIQITTRCMPYDGQVVVTLQDANRPPNSPGVTAFRLTNVTYSGNTVTAQVPYYPIFANRTFYVGVFVYGHPWKTASPGAITIQ